MIALDLDGAPWHLLPQRAAWQPAVRLLVLADVHFGKAAAFRARGVPVPQGTTRGNLDRIDDLIAHCAPRTLVFLGDLFHARESHAPATLAELLAWRARHAALDLVLVEGNHDRAAGAPPATLGITVQDEPWAAGGAWLAHHPQRVAGGAVLAGHLHPTTRLTVGFESVRLPCFWWHDGLLVLPAFGEFTGGSAVTRAAGDRVFAVAGERVVELARPEPAYAGR